MSGIRDIREICNIHAIRDYLPYVIYAIHSGSAGEALLKANKGRISFHFKYLLTMKLLQSVGLICKILKGGYSMKKVNLVKRQRQCRSIENRRIETFDGVEKVSLYNA